MNEIFTTTLTFMSLVASLITLVTFVRTMKKDAEDRGTRQATMDLAIDEIRRAIAKLVEQVTQQEKDIQQMKILFELLLQQHCNNHGQDIRSKL